MALFKFEAIPEELFSIILSNFNLTDLRRSSLVNKFFNQKLNNLNIWIQAVKKLKLPEQLEAKIIEEENLTSLKKTLSSTLKAINAIKASPENVYPNSLLGSNNLNQIIAKVMLYMFPNLVINNLRYLQGQLCLSLGDNIYKSSLPDFSLFNLAKQHPEVALALINNKDLLNFFTAPPYLRFLCLVAAERFELVEYILSKPEEHAKIIRHQDFLLPLKNFPQFKSQLDTRIQNIMGQNYSSLMIFFNRNLRNSMEMDEQPTYSAIKKSSI